MIYSIVDIQGNLKVEGKDERATTRVAPYYT